MSRLASVSVATQQRQEPQPPFSLSSLLTYCTCTGWSLRSPFVMVQVFVVVPLSSCAASHMMLETDPDNGAQCSVNALLQCVITPY